MDSKTQTGFTIYELMITLTIMAILMSIGVPNLLDFTKNSRMTSTANDLLGAFQLARSEAARAKATVTICASANAHDADADCGGTFNDGWIVFQDLDGDLSRTAASESVVRAFDGAPEGVSISTNDDAGFFSFSGAGAGRGDVGGATALQTAFICDSRGNTVASGGRSAARVVQVTPVGRAIALRDVGQIDAVGGCP